MNDLPNPKVSELILIFSNTFQLLELILDEYLLLFLHLMYIIRNNTKKIIENEIAINIKNGIINYLKLVNVFKFIDYKFFN